LLELTNELLAHIQSGGTLVVPSRQRATAVRLAHSVAMLDAGLRVWPSPDVLPWSAWVERELDAARARGESLPRRLSASEEWLLWRAAVHEACEGLAVLMPDALIDPVRQAIGRLDDFGLPLPPASAAETAVLMQARTAFRRRCAELKASGGGSWQDCRAHLRPSPRLLLAGFPALGPARRQWLEQHGARVAADEAADAASVADAAPQVIGCDDPRLEAEAAAQWCAVQLARDPRARLLLVVPRLPQQRHLWERALSQQLDVRSLLDGDDSSGASAYAIEGGRPLDGYPLAAAALRLIALATGEGGFDELSAVLRSPYLSALDRDQSLRLDLWLRERNLGEGGAGMLARLVLPVAAGLGEPAAAVLQALLAAIAAGAGAPAAGAGVAAPAAWAHWFAELLSRCGWPGTGLGADEQQVRMRFDELLGELSAIAPAVRRLQAGEAAELLQAMAQRVSFEPASDDVPVTVTASLDDPIVRYDGIWVAGLSAEIWPPAAQPDALLPALLQRDAGVPEASAAGQLRLALQRMRQWQQRSARCVWSWPRSESELPRDRSPLLGDVSTGPATPQFELHAWLQASAPSLEAWHDDIGPAWPLPREPGGGARLLELQSLCPFRAFAELRLKAPPLPAPAPGIDARLRGDMLHSALEQFWRATGSAAMLHARSRDGTLALLRECVQHAGERIAARIPGAIDAALLRREVARAQRLIGQLIDWELTRAGFDVQSLEAPLRLPIAGTMLPLRPDRVDRLDDGGLVVIDYKTGAAHSLDAYAERLSRPQLPAYAVAVGEQVKVLVAVHLGRDLKLRGVADRPGRVPGPGIEAVEGGDANWPPLLRQWRERLERVMREFLEGRAAVQPQPGACEYCHLQSLCRVDVQVLAAAAAVAADAGDDDGLGQAPGAPAVPGDAL
jgi:probable DNA repair protein